MAYLAYDARNKTGHNRILHKLIHHDFRAGQLHRLTI